MAIHVIILTVLIEMTILAMYINNRALAKAAVQTRVSDAIHANPAIRAGFMRINPRTLPRVARHVPHVNPWGDMANSITDDYRITF